MGKREFIDRLRNALNGRVTPSLVMENLNFYEDYINMEVRKGRSEEEVLAALGDPRLIARTIIETNGDEDVFQGQGAESASYGDYRQSGREQYVNARYGGYDQREAEEGRKYVRLPGWVWLVAVILIVVLVLGTVFSILSLLLPVLLPVLLVLFLIKLFRDWLK